MPAVAEPTAELIVAVLRAAGATVATAESLTAGLLAATIVYATDLKATLAGVDPVALRRDGPVHPDTARALAEGARTRCGADFGVALTGVAGPTEQDGIAVGTVFCAVAGPSGTVVTRWAFDGDRATVRHAAVTVALAELWRAVTTRPD
jgi:nicotinamide-nucleotide amidase